MRKRNWVLLTCGLAVLIFGFGIVGVLAYQQVYVTPAAPADEEPRQVAEAFLREAARGDATAACSYVVDSGGVLNPCREDLEERPSFKALAELPEDIRVARVQVDVAVAVVTSADLDPKPERQITIGLVLTEQDQMWVVRRLDWEPIKHEWTDEEWRRQTR